MAQKKTRYPLLILVIAVTALLLIGALARLRIDADVAAGLPEDNGVLADAVYIFKNHPVQNRIAIDIGLKHKTDPDLSDKDLLVKA